MMLNNLPWTTEIPCQTNYDNEYIYSYLLISIFVLVLTYVLYEDQKFISLLAIKC